MLALKVAFVPRVRVPYPHSTMALVFVCLR